MRKDGPSEGRRIERAHTTDELVELNVTFPPRTPNIPIDLRLFTLLPLPPTHRVQRLCYFFSQLCGHDDGTFAHYFKVPKLCPVSKKKAQRSKINNETETE